MFRRFFISASAIALTAGSMSYAGSNATGFFKVNANADLTVSPVTQIVGIPQDTSFTFSVEANDSVQFSLPLEGEVSIASKSVSLKKSPELRLQQDNLILDAGKSMAHSALTISSVRGQIVSRFTTDANGRITADLSALSRGIYVISVRSKANHFTALMNLSQSNGIVQASGTKSQLRTTVRADESVIYSVSATSKETSHGNLENEHITLSAGDNGTKRINLPEKTNDIAENFKELLDSATYDLLFPNRYGLGREEQDWNPGSVTSSDGLFDFYTHRSLIEAIKAISEVRVEVWNREGGTSYYASKIKWFNKVTDETMEFITHPDYDSSWNIDKAEELTFEVDFADFCAKGDLFTRKRELAAFLANISHETTGMGSTDPDKDWGLYWREEVNWQKGSTALGYIDSNTKTYPAAPGKSYHGRGPIQLSWNVNYGQVSEFLYGDKNVLLDNPELVITTDSDNDGVEDAMLAYQTAIWFWMYPQLPKPSCHDIMTGGWVPSAEDIAAGRDKSQFGMTINVINGGQECGKGDGLDSPLDRIGFYRKYCDFMGVPIPENEYCDCGTMDYLH